MVAHAATCHYWPVRSRRTVKTVDRLKSWAERYLVRGAHYQLFAVAMVIGLISIVGGAVLRLGTGEGATDDSMWWAFLRLTDPGYLGDDQGALARTLSTIITVLGYVLFMGSLVAIMTQWLNSTLRRLESGYTPIVRRNHVLILGWTQRVGIVLYDVLQSENRVRRFLRGLGARGLHIVLLAEEVGPELVQELRERTGERWNPRRVTLRTGTPLRSDHLDRVDFSNAGTILLPAGDFTEGGPDAVDTRTIKALLSISNHPDVVDDDLPPVVAELFDARKIGIAQRAYRGPIEILPSDAIVSRLLSQNVRHPGMSLVFTELLTHDDGNELYVRDPISRDAGRVSDLVSLCPDAIFLGVLRPEADELVPLLNPGPDVELRRGDRFVFLARHFDDTSADIPATLPVIARGAPRIGHQRRARSERRTLLVLGWNHKAPALISELASYADNHIDVTIVSSLDIGEREHKLERYEYDADRIRIEQVHADYIVPTELGRLDVARFDHIVMLGSDWLDSGEESDARTIVGYLLLQELLSAQDGRPQIIIELLDPENTGLLPERSNEVLVSPMILSHMLAQVALRADLNTVYEELFTPRGAEITFRPATDYELSGQMSFADVRRAVHARGDTALGVRSAGEPPRLNPGAGARVDIGSGDTIVLLASY